jgi:hypothetical protein
MTMHLLTLRFLFMNFWQSKRRLSGPIPPTLQIWPLRTFSCSQSWSHPKRSISDGRGDKRNFATRPSHHPAKHIPELEKSLGVVYQQ